MEETVREFVHWEPMHGKGKVRAETNVWTKGVLRDACFNLFVSHQFTVVGVVLVLSAFIIYVS